MVLGGQQHTLAALSLGKTRYRRLGGSQDRSGRVRKISPPPGFDPRTVQPVASCCTDRAIPAPFIHNSHSHNQVAPWPPFISKLCSSTLNLSWARWIHPVTPYSISLSPILMMSTPLLQYLRTRIQLPRKCLFVVYKTFACLTIKLTN